MQGIKLVTFDATNTLLKFKVPPWQYYSIVARDYGFKGTSEILKSRMKDSFKVMEERHPNFGKGGVTWENWWKQLVKLTFRGQMPDYANNNIEIIANKLINEFRTSRCWDVADGSRKLLDVLKKKNIHIGVISNFDPRLVDILKNINLYKEFDFVLTSYDIGFSKPDTKIFESAIKACKALPKPLECLHIGDSFEKDYKGGKAAGWHALMVGSDISNITLVPQKHVFMSILDLCKAVQQNKIYL